MWRSRGRLEVALSLPMPRTTTTNAAEGVPASADLMITAETAVASAASPCLEGKATIHPRLGRWGRWPHDTAQRFGMRRVNVRAGY